MKPQPLDAKLLREFSGMNQTQFWGSVGVTQSGGSRYEAGRRLPKPVLHLLRLIYIEKVDLSQIRREDIELLEYLHAENRELYDRLRKKTKGWVKSRPLS